MKTTEQDINDLKTALNNSEVTVNIIELTEHYEGRIRDLERQLREAHLNNAEKLFRDFSDE